MKLTYRNTTLTHPVEVEGTPTELAQFLNNLQPTNTINTNTNRYNTTNLPAKTTTNNTKTTDDFIKSVYVYEPNPNNDSGRGSYIAQQILLNGTANINNLAAKAKAQVSTVRKTIDRLRSAGAVIEVDGNTIKVISIPTGPFKNKTRSTTKNNNKQTKTIKSSPNLDKFINMNYV